MQTPKIIAIDGPAASGKSTIAEKLAEELGYLFFDTGVMYRAVTLAVLQENISVDDENKIDELAGEIKIDVFPPSKNDGRKYDVQLNGKDVTWEIRTGEVNANVSKISAYKGVRKAMTEQQRRIGLRGSVVMVGRDIGTVVLPEAELKVYLDASVEERAKRRYKEEIERGQIVTYEGILESLKNRDRIDSTREIAPLKAADDARTINTDNLSIEEVQQEIIRNFK